jgi:predicted DCC family thiol-disulfide oxidoreductase YuxK
MSDETKVLYNGECPVCAFEINHYAAYSKDKALPLRFDDLNVAELSDWGLTQDQAARRLYVLKGGELTSGIPAFLILWRDMPRYRWLARLVGVPGIKQFASLGYDWVLAPIIYRWHLRRQARKQNVEHS